MYSIERGWIDCSGKCRTWKLISPSGEALGEVTTKRAALRLAELLSLAERPRTGETVLPLRIVPDGALWSAVDPFCNVRAQASSRELLIDTLPDIVDAIQTAAAMRVQMTNTGQIHHSDASWIV